jgi:hypothetical protein
MWCSHSRDWPSCEDNLALTVQKYAVGLQIGYGANGKVLGLLTKIPVAMQQACTNVDHKEDVGQRNQQSKDHTTTHTHCNIYERIRESPWIMNMSTVNPLGWVHTCNVTAYRNTVSWQCGWDSWPRNVSKVGYAVTLRAFSVCCRYLAVVSKEWYGYGRSRCGRASCCTSTPTAAVTVSLRYELFQCAVGIWPSYQRDDTVTAGAGVDVQRLVPHL